MIFGVYVRGSQTHKSTEGSQNFFGQTDKFCNKKHFVHQYYFKAIYKN